MTEERKELPTGFSVKGFISIDYHDGDDYWFKIPLIGDKEIVDLLDDYGGLVGTLTFTPDFSICPLCRKPTKRIPGAVGCFGPEGCGKWQYFTDSVHLGR